MRGWFLALAENSEEVLEGLASREGKLDRREKELYDRERSESCPGGAPGENFSERK